MTQLVVYLPDIAEGALVEIPPYGVFHNKTRNEIPDVMDEETGDPIKSILIGSDQDFDGAGWVAPKEDDEDLLPAKNEDMGASVDLNEEGSDL